MLKLKTEPKKSYSSKYKENEREREREKYIPQMCNPNKIRASIHLVWQSAWKYSPQRRFLVHSDDVVPSVKWET